ncbi:MAG TPA: potassium/proton antiporter [Gemmatimonadales bacterium]|nr:potassium/proton antiporter [Gemmatimonadales bacterium]
MHLVEPNSTALLLLTAGVLLALSVLFSRASARFSMPVVLIFLLIGMAAGTPHIGGIVFQSFPAAFRIGTAALVLILFDGGLNTPYEAVRRTWKPAGVLATAGVIGTCLVLAGLAHLVGFRWQEALVLAAIVSSTDAAMVFSVLRGSGLQLKKRVGATLEVESGINDPMAFMLTIAFTQNLLATGSLSPWAVPLDILLQIAVGLGCGVLIGIGGRRVLGRLRVASGLYVAFTVALAFLAFGVATLVHGSGFLAVYVAGVVLGNGALPLRTSLFRVHDAIAWLSQITMFLILGLLVDTTALLDFAWAGLALGLALALVARPIVVTLCLLPFRYPAREVGYIAWIGLRGAVPIVLATFPLLAGAPGSERIFLMVFCIVVVSTIIPGSTVAWVTRWLKLESKEPPLPPALLNIESRTPLTGDLLGFHVDSGLAVAGVTLAELSLPDGAAVTLIIRGSDLIPPKGASRLEPGDHVYLVSRPEDRGFIQLLFGHPEED